MSELSNLRQQLSRIEREFTRELCDARERIGKLERQNKDQADQIARLEGVVRIDGGKVAA